MTAFGDLGPTLHRAGWDVIPVERGTKRPTLRGWQHGLSSQQVQECAANGYASGSVGLLARRFPGVDVDVLDEECAAAIEALARRCLGDAPVRVGTWPKRLLMYGTDTPLRKVKVYLEGPNGPTGPDGKDYAVEILGDGQQYLIYGRHPDGHDYEWRGGPGPGNELDVWDLPAIDAQRVTEFVEQLPQALPAGWQVRRGGTALAKRDGGQRAMGRPDADDPFAALKSPLDGWDAARILAEIAPHLDAEMHYDEWVAVGQALHHQFGGEDQGFELWDTMFQGSSKYAGPQFGLERWESFHAVRGGGVVTLASLLMTTKAAREQSARAERDVLLQSLFDEIDSTPVVQDLEEKVAKKAARVKSLSDSERGLLAKRIVARNKALGGAATLDQARTWLRYRPVSGVGGAGFAHVNDEGHPLCTLENLTALLRQLEITIRYNVISKTVEVLVPGASGSRDNRDNATLATVLSECEKVRMPTRHVPQFLLSLADQNLFNPVMTWITSRAWDGVSRLEAFYATVTQAEDTPAEMKRLLMRKWLIQAVAAAASPDGIAAQGILTFTGEQNIGKTTWFRRLVPADMDLVKTGLTLDLKSKDSILTALRYWLVELGEVDATFRKSDISALKSFVTQDTDNIRRPYAVNESCYGRRTVFGASVNDEEFLADETGNRRFWTIHAVAYQLDHGVDMQQLWAEAYELWKAGETFHMDQGQVARLNTHNAQFAVTNPIFERLAGAFNWEGATSWEWVTVTQALIAAGIRDPQKKDTIQGSTALKKLNGKRRRKSNSLVLFAVPGDFQDFCRISAGALQGKGQ